MSDKFGQKQGKPRKKQAFFSSRNPLKFGPPTSQNCSSERTLVGALWKMSRIFREISCDHFAWKSKDENLQNFSPNVHRIFRPSLVKKLPRSESVKCRFSKCRFSVLNLKFDFISDGGCTREKQIQKALGSLPPCGNGCRFSESAICSSRVHPPSEIKSNFKFKALRWRPLRWRLTLSDQNFALGDSGP